MKFLFCQFKFIHSVISWIEFKVLNQSVHDPPSYPLEDRDWTKCWVRKVEGRTSKNIVLAEGWAGHLIRVLPSGIVWSRNCICPCLDLNILVHQSTYPYNGLHILFSFFLSQTRGLFWSTCSLSESPPVAPEAMNIIYSVNRVLRPLRT